MKKIVIAIVALCVLAAFALPPIIAGQTEKVLADSINQNDAFKQYVEVDVVDYQKGYRQSTAQLDFKLGPTYRAMIEGGADDDDAPMSAEQRQDMRDMLDTMLSMDVTIEHGPVLLSNGIGVGLNSYRATLSDTEMVKEFEDFIGVEDFLEIVSRTTLTGTTKMTTTLKPFEFEEDGDTFRFSGMRSDGSFSQRSGHLVATGEAGNMSILSDEVDMTIEDVSFDLDNYLLDGGLVATGTTSFSLGSMTINSKEIEAQGKGAVKINGLAFSSLVSEPDANNTLDIEAAYKVESVESADLPSIEDMTFGFAFRNLSTKVFAEYQELMMTADLDEEQLEALQDVLYDALTASPTIELGPFNGIIDGESYNGQIDVKMDAAKLPPADEFFFADPTVWMTIATADGEINVSEKLVNMAADNYMRQQIMASMPPDAEMPEDELNEIVEQQRPMMTKQLIDQGIVTLENGEYKTTAKFVDGELTVNGTPFPLGALMGGGP